jgi:hypothetical protein
MLKDLGVFRGSIQMLSICQPIVMFEATSKSFLETRKLLEDAQYSCSMRQVLENLKMVSARYAGG